MKIVAFVAIALISSFLLLYIFQIWSQSYVEIFRLEREFFSSPLDPNEKKIFVIGSSEIGMMNATYVNEHLGKSAYVVYNLSIPSDTPTQRLRSIDKIISLRPEFVIYGVGHRDFAEKSTLIKSKENTPNQILPTPDDLLQYDLLSQKINNFLNLDSPKFVTVQVLNKITSFFNGQDTLSEKSKFLTIDNTPFMTYTLQERIIKNTLDLQRGFEQHPPNLGHIDLPAANEEAIAITHIVDMLTNNHIKVVVIAIPHAQVFHNSLEQHNKLSYALILDEISKHNTTIYDLDTKYQDMNIWYDYHHVSINPQVTILNDDIITIIRNELN